MLLINYGHKARLYYVELPLPRVLLYNRNCLKTLLTNSSPRQVSDCRSKLQKYFSTLQVRKTSKAIIGFKDVFMTLKILLSHFFKTKESAKNAETFCNFLSFWRRNCDAESKTSRGTVENLLANCGALQQKKTQACFGPIVKQIYLRPFVNCFYYFSILQTQQLSAVISFY